MSTNKDLWKRVAKTDPHAVKPITGKQYQGNSPKPYWLIERATEEFGPVGIGWGVVVKSERFERLGEFDVLHVAVVSVWYVKDGVRSETFDQMGGTKAAYKTAKGTLMVDEDAGKKSVTDGMVKCLSMIGFAGDIFSGRWDDSKYVESVRKEYDEKHSLERQLEASIEAAKAAKEAKRRANLDDFALQLIEWHKEGNDLEAIKAWYDPKSFDAEHDQANEDRLYVWSRLKTESKLRSTIKANRPEHIDAHKETA
jgi:hypothetical protein